MTTLRKFRRNSKLKSVAFVVCASVLGLANAGINFSLPMPVFQIYNPMTGAVLAGNGKPGPSPPPPRHRGQSPPRSLLDVIMNPNPPPSPTPPQFNLMKQLSSLFSKNPLNSLKSPPNHPPNHPPPPHHPPAPHAPHQTMPNLRQKLAKLRQQTELKRQQLEKLQTMQELQRQQKLILEQQKQLLKMQKLQQHQQKIMQHEQLEKQILEEEQRQALLYVHDPGHSTVQFYFQENLAGPVKQVGIHEEMQCQEVPRNGWGQRPKSLWAKHCITLFENGGCQGNGVQVAGMVGELGSKNMHYGVNSFKPCEKNIRVRFYSKDGHGQTWA